MAKDRTSSTVTPRLRFPRFRDKEGWWIKEASDLFKNRTEDGVDGLPIYSVTLNDGLVMRSSLDRKVDDIAESGGNSKVCRGDIAYNTMRMWQGAFGVATEDCMVSPAYVVLAPRDGVVSHFYGYFLKLDSSLRLLTSHSRGLTKDRLRLYYKDFEDIPLPHPMAAEQQKVADCLKSLDELLAAQSRQMAALAAHKRSLMQQLFPREGATLPLLRFPEFHNASEWQPTPLSQVIEVASGQVDPTDPRYCGLPHVGGENIESETGNLLRLRSAREDAVISGKYRFDERDILYSKIRPALNKVAAPLFKGVCSADIYPIRPSTAKLLRPYLVYLLRSKSFVEYATKHSARGKIPKINRSALTAYTAMLPSPAEQQRIADCLYSLDTRIAAEANKLAALRKHKQGLMQQLFASLEDE